MEAKTNETLWKRLPGKRRPFPFKGEIPSPQVSYKRFRRRIIRRRLTASTPLAARWQSESSVEFDNVCVRLELDSPPSHHDRTPRIPQGSQSALESGVSAYEAEKASSTVHAFTGTENATEQRWVWTTAIQESDNPQPSGPNERRHHVQPFSVLNQAESTRGKALMKLAAPSLLNDYYTSLLDCSSQGLVALALGSSVYIWNSETRALLGCLDPSPGRGRSHCQSITSLCWSQDGMALCIGTRQGEVQVWDVERRGRMRCLVSHLSVVGALSWKQQLLSSGSVLGHIHHLDPRAPAPLVGSSVQSGGICSLQWSPGDDQLASGSTEGHLHIWDRDITGVKRSRRPLSSMRQPSAVKAMGWCPWQRNVIATGGGWRDGEVRIWDTDSASCLSSVNTKSQICSLRWAECMKYLVTAHGAPHHKVISWAWESSSLRSMYGLTGHSQRVLHLAIKPDSNRIFSAGADQCLNVWDLSLSP